MFFGECYIWLHGCEVNVVYFSRLLSYHGCITIENRTGVLNEISRKISSIKKRERFVPGAAGRKTGSVQTGHFPLGVRGLRYNSDKLKKAL